MLFTSRSVLLVALVPRLLVLVARALFVLWLVLAWESAVLRMWLPSPLTALAERVVVVVVVFRCFTLWLFSCTIDTSKHQFIFEYDNLSHDLLGIMMYAVMLIEEGWWRRGSAKCNIVIPWRVIGVTIAYNCRLVIVVDIAIPLQAISASCSFLVLAQAICNKWARY